MSDTEELRLKVHIGNLFYAASFGYTFPDGYYGGWANA